MQVLGRLSFLWPYRELTDLPPPSFFCGIGKNVTSLGDEDEWKTIRLVDDAFSRICSRIQDPSRKVRQLAAEIMSDLAEVSIPNA